MTKPIAYHLLPAALRRRVLRSVEHYAESPEILVAACAAASIVLAVWPDDDADRVLAIKGAHLLNSKATKATLVAFPVCCHACAIEAQARFGAE